MMEPITILATCGNNILDKLLTRLKQVQRITSFTRQACEEEFFYQESAKFEKFKSNVSDFHAALNGLVDDCKNIYHDDELSPDSWQSLFTFLQKERSLLLDCVRELHKMYVDDNAKPDEWHKLLTALLAFVTTTQNNATETETKACSLELCFMILTETGQMKLDEEVVEIQAKKIEEIEEIIKMPSACSSMVNFVNDYGWTPLHVAVMQSNVSVVKLLLRYASKDTLDSVQGLGGLGVLHYAVISGNSETVEILLKEGADPFAKTSQGLTPLQLVQNNQGESFEKIRVLLNKYDAI